MATIFKEIRNSVDGVIGSYLMNIEGEIIGHDVPSLFENELIRSSSDLFQLIDIVKSERPINCINVKADKGFIQLAINDSYILGTFASKHADESLLNLVIKKAIDSIRTEDIVPMGTNVVASETPAQMSSPVEEAPPTPGPAAEKVPSQAGEEVDNEVRVALCQAVKSKVKIMYGDKRAESIVSDAFEQAGARRDTRNAQELKAVFDILASGIMAKMLGKKKAKRFLDDLYEKYGLT
ncbi:MAG: hypothetical protein P1P80_05680 [ANME-2 cluster archaeon]|nr:hypothetical protein [ANME-2 cluster archaeon]